MFKQLEQVIQLKKANIFDYYNAGIEKVRIENNVQRLGLTPTESLASLYQWHDGLKDWTVPSVSSSIFPFGIFVSLDTAIKAYKEIIEEL